MAQRMFTTLVIVATVFTVAIGCARTSARTRSTPAASPSSASTDVAGTWRGSAWELAGGIAAARTDATLQLNPDQTWSARWKTNQGKEQTASGTYTTSGNRVFLKSSSGGSTSLVHRENDLYGMLDSAVQDLDVQLDLKRVR
ncbi:MAG: hypothetical protein DME08_05460 [Candidatus Rokuibacteriota bacterium]|nr:MAG: hypothetical protein DME08_05460 [Candidatus Rokubacteria bacterium]